MPLRRLTLLALAALPLAACSGDIVRYPSAPVANTDRVRIPHATVEVAEVTLPTYAAVEEIYIQDATGALTASNDLLWADEPSRAVTLTLVRNLSEITGARIAPGPWPYEQLADARLEVNVEEMVARTTGSFHISGQYVVAAEAGLGRDRSGFFDITVPLVADPDARAIAAARAAAVSQLAGEIARNGLR
ncbi:hypothetical protein EKE94_08345 [Mesobaculum littorinae]|uniref:ABC-type transport auxiliary lipoprotein component domain-containing protein n=1 Tax=Mesobaculum littorinae TaxID=2486419 RepID=A0A438AJJ8_9RHOB|nr:ABC-type transport auxiliary lipoprotein family protein [Mesobaculum littorinae]RVV98890.1 hypothetical protein EKE94_08345 [Mesobaculum littorinae]